MLVSLAALCLLAACQSTVPKEEPPPQPAVQPAPVAPPQPVIPLEPVGPPPIPPSPNVALLVPLSGPHARVGEALLNAAQMALFDIAGDEMVLIVRDTGGTPEGAAAALESAFEAGASLILGPLFATSARAISETALAREVNLIAFSNDISVAQAGVFVMGVPPSIQVERIVSFAHLQGYQRFAVMAPQTAYGNTVVDALQEAVALNGAELARVAMFDPNASDVSAEARQLASYDARRRDLLARRNELAGLEDEASKAALRRLDGLDTLGSPPFDAVLLPMGGRNLMTIAPLLAFYDVDPGEVRFLGTGLWDAPRLGAEPTLQGGWFAAPPPALWQRFKARYKALYDSDPPRIATLAYDATALAAVLSRSAASAGQLPDFSVPAIAQGSGFAGTDGIFRFSTDGVIERGLAVVQVERDGLVEIDPAPTTFEDLTYEGVSDEGLTGEELTN